MARKSARRQREPTQKTRRTGLDRARIVGCLEAAACVVLCAKLAVIVVGFDPAADTPFVAPKVLASHALAYALFGLLAALAVVAGRSAFRWSWLHVAVLAFIVANTVATVFGVDDALALFGTHNRMLGLATLMDGGVTYFAVATLIRTRRRTVALISTVVGSTFLVLTYEAVQLLGRDPFDWNIVGTISPFSTLGQPTTLAYFLTTIAIAVAALALLAPGLPVVTRVAAVAFGVVVLLGAIATGTRSVVFGLGAGGLLLWLVVLLRQDRMRERVLVAGAGVLVTAALVAGVAVTPLGARIAATLDRPATSESTDDLLNRFDPSTAGRLTLYGMAFEMLEQRPLFGYGPDSFAAAMPAFRPAGAPTELRQPVVSSAHGWLPQIAATSGMFGLVCYLAVIAIAFILALRARGFALAGALAIALGAHLATGLTSVNEITTDTVTWVILGAVAAATTSPNAGSAASRMRLPMSTAAFASVLVIVGVATAATVLPAFNASRAARVSQDSRLARQVPAAIDAGLRATAADPGRAEYWRRLALAYVAAGRWRDAAASFERARSLAPYDVHNIGDLIAAKAAGGEQADRASLPDLAEQMVRIDPNNPYAQLTKATVMQFVGRQNDAAGAIQRAVELDPGSTNVQLYVAAAQIFLAVGRTADAERAARDGIAIIDRTEITLRSVPLRYEHARALAALGRVDEALTELDLVVALQPSNIAADQLRTQLRAGH